MGKDKINERVPGDMDVMVSSKITFLIDGNRPLITSSPCFHDEEQFDGGQTVMCYVFPFCVKGLKS